MSLERPSDLGPSDEELVLDVADGETAAFDRLVERYQRKAASVAYRLLSNTHDALEVTQEAFIKAYRNLGSLDDPARFRPWLMRIVTNLALNFRRDRAVGGRRAALEGTPGNGGDLRDLIVQPAHSELQPGARLAAEELSERIQAALAELPEQQRAALVLFSLEEMPQKDVAAILDCSVEAVKWHVFQARRKLKDRLAEHL